MMVFRKTFGSGRRVAVLLGFLLLFGFPVNAPGVERDLTELSIEELLKIRITSVSRKPQTMSDAPAAVFVITQDDIRRAGVTSIPEALRLAPGVEVAQIDGNKWAITARGFNGRFANKLLVLMDGRSVYTPLFSGVFWEMQDTLLEDVERIEVIRGPGATLWGANAVNGVINIITKHARDTEGTLVTFGMGTEERVMSGVRLGAGLGEDSYARIYAKYFKRDEAAFPSGNDADDDWDVLRAGFRFDRESVVGDALTFQGDMFRGDAGQTVTVPSLVAPFSETFAEDNRIEGGNLLFRWKSPFTESSNKVIQLYYDHYRHEDSTLGERRDTFDLDFQHRFAFGTRHEIVWGIGYRYTADDLNNTFTVSFDPDSRDDHLYSAFLQDEIKLLRERLFLTVGSKFEHNEFTGFEIQPNVRILWTPNARHTVWAAISRAVRTPSQAEHDIRINTEVIPDVLPVILTAQGNRNFESETLLASELGYRVFPTENLFLDIAVFYNLYRKLRTLEPGAVFLENSPAPPHFVQPFDSANKMDGKTYGAELAADFRPLDWWRLQAAYSYLQIDLDPDGDSLDTVSESAKGESPHNRFSLRSSMDLRKDLEFDLWLRYVDELPSLGVDSYLTLDARLAWRPRKDIELSLVGQNLLDRRHAEFASPLFISTLPTEVERGVYGKLTWNF